MMGVADGAEAFLYGRDLGVQISEQFLGVLELVRTSADHVTATGGDGAAVLAKFAENLRIVADHLDPPSGR